MMDLAEELAGTDLEGALERDRPDTSYSLVCPTNIRYYVYKLNYTAGQEPYTLPEWVIRKNCLVDVKYFRQPQFYNNLCLFRCIAHHVNNDISQFMVNEFSLYMCHKYMTNKEAKWDYETPMHEQTHMDPEQVERFPGIYMREMKDIEQYFDLDIYIYQATKDGKKMRLVYFPDLDGARNQHKPMHLLFLTPTELIQGGQFGVGHFVYVREWRTLCKCYVRTGCNMNFSSSANCRLHMRHTCIRKVNGRKEVFPGTIAKTSCSLIEKLFRVGMTVDQDQLYFNQFITMTLSPCWSPSAWWMMVQVRRQKY